MKLTATVHTYVCTNQSEHGAEWRHEKTDTFTFEGDASLGNLGNSNILKNCLMNSLGEKAIGGASVYSDSMVGAEVFYDDGTVVC